MKEKDLCTGKRLVYPEDTVLQASCKGHDVLSSLGGWVREAQAYYGAFPENEQFFPDKSKGSGNTPEPLGGALSRSLLL